LILLFLLQPLKATAQDTVEQKSDRQIIHTDSIFPKDSLAAGQRKKPVQKKPALTSKVDYAATDSLRFEIKGQRVYLFKRAEIKYQDINLKADSIQIDFTKHTIKATGVPDSSGTVQGSPEFTEGGQTFKSKTIRYNYDTKKGYIQVVFTKQDEGFLHGKTVKKMENNVTYIKDGSYTTCDHPDHPDFEFRFNKGKVIPGKRVITGPAYMVIEDVPTPLAIPFGYFPNRVGRRSGILIPSYGESTNRGFFLIDGGYYWGASDHFDMYLRADIYSRGSWGVKPLINYNSRYHYHGSLNLGYSVNILGSYDSPDYSKEKDFIIQWTHSQDPKARPYSLFSANVNIMSSTYNTNNLVSNATSYLTNTFESSVNYSTSFANNLIQLNLNGHHSQNTLTHEVTITLPQIALSVNQLYPFRRSIHTGKMKWYENISIKYNLDAQNNYSDLDSMLFKPGWQKYMQNGIRHSAPITGTFRIFKNINWTNTINLTDRMYFQTTRYAFIPSSKTGVDSLVKDTVYSFANAIDGSISSSFNTRVYGMFQFKRGPIIGIRHMLIPTVGFSYTPNFGAPSLGYWRRVENDTNKIPLPAYSIFGDGIYGGPPGQKSGLVTFTLGNNLEMKVRNRKDTVTGTRKVMLIDNFTITTSYNLAKDTVQWSPVAISGYTTLFKALKITYGGQWDMYVPDSLGRRTNRTEWAVNRRLLRLDNSTWDVGLNYSLSSAKAKKVKKPVKGSPEEIADINNFYNTYVDFDIPWSFSVNYNLHFGRTRTNLAQPRVYGLTQTLGFNGQLNLTPRWKLNLSTGWDFVHGQLSYTNIRLDRDLHCWEMHFSWTPKGGQQQWSFSINVKASVLQDLKLDKKKDFRDYSQ
jgi:lipopolysaccharide assembly outer membrane protein LptD (OstA)